MDEPTVPVPAINPDFLASHQKMSEAMATSAAAQAVAAGAASDMTEEDIFYDFYKLCVNSRIGNTPGEMANFADGCLKELRDRYPVV
jgi:hypothetical protein